MAANTTHPLAGKNCLVVGAAGYSRIGGAIARHLAESGAAIVAHGADGAQRETERLSKELSDIGGRSIAVTCDPTSASAVTEMFGTVAKTFGQLDVMVGAASIVPGGSLLDSDVATWQTTLQVNLKVPFLTGREAARMMIESGGGGKILFVSSHAARVGIKGLGVYSTSQAGIAGLVRTMALELADHRINVNALSVGSMRDDPGFSETTSLNDGAPFLQRWSGGIRSALGRPEGEAPDTLPLRGGVGIDDVAGAVADLVSFRGDYVTGQVVDLTGGQLIGR